MAILNFDTTELISFFVSLIGLAFIAYIYFFKRKKSINHAENSLLNCMLIIFIFIFLNRLFTNVEAIAYKSFFNLLEHLSSLAAGAVAVIFSWKGFEGWSKSSMK